MKNIIYRILSKIDEPYRIRHGFGLSPLRTAREVKALIDFCDAQLNEYHIVAYNKEKAKVFRKTLKLHRSGRHKQFADYVLKHVDWYWS